MSRARAVLVLENGARLALSEVLAKGYPGADIADLMSFIYDRLKVYLRDQGIRHDVIDACLAMPGADDLALLVARARALNDVLATEDGENLVQGFKRGSNILSQAEAADGVEYSFGADVKFAEMDEEKALFAALEGAWIADDALIVWEEGAPIRPPAGLKLCDARRYGVATISMLEKV